MLIKIAILIMLILLGGPKHADAVEKGTMDSMAALHVHPGADYAIV